MFMFCFSSLSILWCPSALSIKLSVLFQTNGRYECDGKLSTTKEEEEMKQNKTKNGEEMAKAKLMIPIGFPDVFGTKNTKSVEMHIHISYMLLILA